MLSVFVALDRSGSMQGEPWTNSIESLNEYIKSLQKEKVEGEVTIIAFDTTDFPSRQPRLTPVVQNQSIAYFEALNSNVLAPAGMTPLYDAAASVMNQALDRNSERTVVVILTDGHENASTEYTRSKVKSKVEELQARNWEVIFLGANFDVATYTADAGLKHTKMRNFDLNNAAERTRMYTDLGNATVAYASAGIGMDLSK